MKRIFIIPWSHEDKQTQLNIFENLFTNTSNKALKTSKFLYSLLCHATALLHSQEWNYSINIISLMRTSAGTEMIQYRLSFRELQNILSKFVYCRNRISCENFKLKLCTCVQSHALGTRTKFQLGILPINVISGSVYFNKIILKSSWNVRETILRTLRGWKLPMWPWLILTLLMLETVHSSFGVQYHSWRCPGS